MKDGRYGRYGYMKGGREGGLYEGRKEGRTI
jgi:hypothetical protein